MSPINVPKPTDLSSSNVLRQWSSKSASPALAKPINLSTTLSSRKLGISTSPDFSPRPAPAHQFLLHQATAMSILPPQGPPTATIPLSKSSLNALPFSANSSLPPSSSARNAKPLEVLGTYDPVPKATPYGEEDSKPIKDIKLDTSRAKYWLGVGAQPSEPVWRLLSMIGLLEPRFSVQKMQEKERALRGGGGKGVGGAQSEGAVATLEGR